MVMNQQEDFFNEYYESIKSYKWVGVQDLSEQVGVSTRTIFQWLKDGKIEGTKWKGKRLINSISVIGFLLKKKCIEIQQIKEKEIRDKIEYNKFVRMGEDLFD